VRSYLRVNSCSNHSTVRSANCTIEFVGWCFQGTSNMERLQTTLATSSTWCAHSRLLVAVNTQCQSQKPLQPWVSHLSGQARGPPSRFILNLPCGFGRTIMENHAQLESISTPCQGIVDLILSDSGRSSHLSSTNGNLKSSA
jgi:hypothetical protein